MKNGILGFLGSDVISRVGAGVGKVYPHFFVIPMGVVHKTEVKLRGHILHTEPPSATGLLLFAAECRVALPIAGV